MAFKWKPCTIKFENVQLHALKKSIIQPCASIILDKCDVPKHLNDIIGKMFWFDVTTK